MKRRKFSPAELRFLRGQAENQYESMRGGRRYRNLDFAVYIVVVVLIALSIRAFLVEPIRVDGDSMIPTLLDGEHMFVEKVSYWFNEPARGDVIICYYPNYTESCVKRVIGLPGESVEVHGGAIYINGVMLRENAYWSGTIIGDMDAVVVGESEVFVVGDNRNGSKDSRNASVGAIPLSKVEGRVRAVVWPISEYHRIEHVEY